MLDALLPLLARLSRPSRRDLLRWAALSTTAIGCRPHRRAPDDGHPTPPAPPPPPQTGKVLGPAEWQTLECATSRILPSEGGAGAREARVIAFVDGQLATRELAPMAPIMLAGARLLDKWARARYQRAFAELDEPSQDAVLRALSRAEIPVKAFPQAEFFRALHMLTLEGFLSDPIHGGNADMVGWQAIGFPEPHLRTPGDPAHRHHLPRAK
jgi:gluconate 2-dehydrogenase gamma chain